MQSFLQRTAAFLTPSSSASTLPKLSPNSPFVTAPSHTSLFPKVDPAVDGEGCDQDCATCTIRYPDKFTIDEDDKLYGHVKGWSTHLVVATGKTDWLRDVADEKGSVMEAIEKAGTSLSNGRLMYSASNLPIPDADGDESNAKTQGTPTSVLLLPAFRIFEHVRPADVPDLLKYYVERSVTTTTPLESASQSSATTDDAERPPTDAGDTNGRRTPSPLPMAMRPASEEDFPPLPTPPTVSTKFTIRDCPHRAIILLCSQKTRDARCGQSAPLLRREFERHLRPLGLYRDSYDERPGGVGVYFISHVGGHKYSANCMVYRRQSSPMGGEQGLKENGGAVQGIWLARVRPEDCEGIVKFTVLQGLVVKPERQLRGGFDRGRGLVSW